jgi:hypothetical protein
MTPKPLSYPFSQPYNVEKGCVLYLTAERNNKWYDYSGKGNHGSIVGACWTSKGIWGPALSFDGVDDYVVCGNDISVNPTIITLEAWIKSNAIGARQKIIDKPYTSLTEPWYQYSLEIREDGEIYFSLSIDGIRHYVWTYNFAIQANNWYHITATYDGSTMHVYKNAVKYPTSVSVSGNISSYNTNLEIGRYSIQNCCYFYGLIDKVYIYNRALSAEEIRERFLAYSPT